MPHPFLAGWEDLPYTVCPRRRGKHDVAEFLGDERGVADDDGLAWLAGGAGLPDDFERGQR